MKPKVEIRELEEAPNLQEIKDKFGVGEETIISYGNKIFVKDKTMSRDLLVHELVHCDRQNFSESSAKRWWEMYMRDKGFRLTEEILAYRQQYQFCCAVYKDRNKRDKILRALAKELSSSRYGNIISDSESMARIK
jgi:hypothetical protein